MNTQPISEPIGHWVAVRVAPSVIEYFDSFAEEPPKQFYTNIKKILPPGIYQNKINRCVVHQSENSNVCGYFAMKFIKDRIVDKNTWKEAAGFIKIDKSKLKEEELKIFIKKIKRYGYIKV
jgi:hypothetical protein